MRKFTKLTALALALALILGMTAFAGTPSTLIMTDDFSDAYDSEGIASLATLKENRGTLSIKNASGVAQTTKLIQDGFVIDTTTGVNKYLYHSKSSGTITNVNGKTALTTNNFDEDHFAALAYTIPDGPWTYEDHADGAEALVAQIGFSPKDIDIAANASATNTGNQGAGGVSGIYATYTESGTTSTAIRGISGLKYYSAKTANNTPEYVRAIKRTKTSTNDAKNGSTNIYMGDDTVITTVVRPYYDVTSEGTVLNTEDSSLNVITMYKRHPVIEASGNGDYSSYVNHGGNFAINSVNGFVYSTREGVLASFYDFKLYKVSLDSKDFTIDTTATKTTGVAVDSAFEIIFSQPLAEGLGYGPLGNDATIATGINVTDQDGKVYTCGTDYTYELTEKVEENKVKGIMKIVPAESWDFSKTYTVKLPVGLKNIARITMDDYYTGEDDVDEVYCAAISFTTQVPPTYDVTLKAYAGLEAKGEELTALSAGTTYFAVSAKHSDGKVIANGTLRLEIKDANGNTVKYVTAKKALGTGTATFGAAFKLEAGMTARAFVVGTEGVATK